MRTVTYLSVDANVLVGVDSHQNRTRICLWNIKESFVVMNTVKNKNESIFFTLTQLLRVLQFKQDFRFHCWNA